MVKEKKKILVHICCAPCVIFLHQSLLENDFEVMGYFYNPNIHPYQEYEERLHTVKEYARQKNLKIIYKDEYNLEDFLQGVVFRENQRCNYCYHTRLLSTAQAAKKGKFDFFTTTLLYSKFQNHTLIKEMGTNLGREYGVEFYYQDFRLGWKEGINISKEMGLYRQQYCGCIYSEKERYMGN